jgi:predicted N-acetyltransferase YhbS
MLFVAPLWQWRGLGTALVSSVLNELHRSGERILRSRYHLGNDLSLAWHRKFGFVEEPDLSLAQLYYHCAHHELRRREKTGDLTESERARLCTELERWHKQVEELRRIGDVQGIETVMPSLLDY